MRTAIVTPVMASGERGGAEALYAGLTDAMRRAGEAVDRIEVPVDESSFEAVLASYLRCYELDLSAYDLVISTKAPTYMLRHPNHVSYLLHTLRVFYDMFEAEYGAGSPEHHRQRSFVQELDRLGLHPQRTRAHFANGHETFLRLQAAADCWREIRFQALHHPPLLQGFRTSPRADFVLLPGRLHRWKRAHLVVEAMRHVRSDMELLIAGSGEDEQQLRRLAAGDGRVRFLGSVEDEQLLDLYSRALVVPFVPKNEDYGLVTIEAFLSGKPVITCNDSGETTRIVRDGETGFIVPPDPREIARRIDELCADGRRAQEMGERGRQSVQHITWERVVSALLDAGRPAMRSSTQTPWAAPARTPRIAVLDMQPIEPATGGGRLRLLGLYHDLGLPARYTGTYDWPGPGERRLQLSPSLEETTLPLSAEHFDAAAALAQRVGHNVIDVAFPRLGHLSPRFIEAAGDEAAAADIVVFSHPWLYTLVKDRLERGRQLVVYDAHNVEACLRAALLDDGAEGTRLAEEVAAVESALCREADLVLACSQEDREGFHRLYGTPFDRVMVVPNGAFTRRIRPAAARSRLEAKMRLGLGCGPVALFIGSAYAPNREAVDLIVGQIAPALPRVRFVICGGVGEAYHGRDLPPNVVITGSLDEDAKLEYLEAADLALNPMLSGSGTNVKMFDFMAAGLPIVTTPAGARGIAIAAEQPFHVCEPGELADGVRLLLEEPDAAAAMGQAGRELADSFYSWERISRDLGRLLNRAWQSSQRRPRFSVVVATYERHALLDDLVRCLQAQQERDFEVIIVDQSREPWQAADRDYGFELEYVHTDVVGAVSARNTGAFFARGDVLAFTDDDCRPFPDWLAAARPYFQDPGIAGVEGLITSDRLDDARYREVTNEGFEGIGFMTANLLLRREAFLRAGGFDLRFDHPHFREDTELAWRALEFGAIPFGHDVRVYHPPHPRDLERESLAERNRFFEKDPLLLARHPQRYRELFLREQHYRRTAGFWEHFERGAAKYGVALPDWLIAARNDVLDERRMEVPA